MILCDFSSATKISLVRVMSTKSKLLVHAFVHEIQTLLKAFNVNLIIPQEIIDLCCIFYIIDLQLFIAPHRIKSQFNQIARLTPDLQSLKTWTFSGFGKNKFLSPPYFYINNIYNKENNRDTSAIFSLLKERDSTDYYGSH